VKKLGNRWLLLTQYYSPEIGAPQIRLRCLVRELRHHNIQVEVLTAMPNYPKGEVFPEYRGKVRLCEKIDDTTVKRVWVYPGTGKSPLIRLLNYFSFTLCALVAALFGPKPDILFVESQPLSLGVVALVMKWVRGVPYIYNVPDLQVDVARQMGFIRNEAFLKGAFWLEQVFLKHAWKVSTVTHRFIQHFQDRGLSREKLTFLPNGADTEFLTPRAPVEDMLERWNLQGKKVFLYVGTHAFYHGLDTLIQAAKLLKNDTAIAFLMIGNGPERQRIIKLAEDLGVTNVVFGQSPYWEMGDLYSICYASVATLRNLEVAKSMRLSKVFPSLSCGVPVIYAGIGESVELIRDNNCGICVEPENAELLAAAVKRLAINEGVRDHLGNMGRKLVEAEYSWRVIVNRWMQELGQGYLFK